MAPISDKQQRIIDYGIQQAQETLTIVDLLMSNEKIKAAINRIYHVVHYMMMAAAAKNDVKLSLPEPLIEWFQNTIIKEQKAVPFKYNIIISNLYRDCLAADYDPLTQFTYQEVQRRYDEMKEFNEIIQKYLTTITEIPTPEVVKFISKALYIADSNSASSEAKEAASKFNRFLNFKFFLNNPKAKQTFEDYKKDRTNAKIEGQLEMRIDDCLENEAKLKEELAGYIMDLKKYDFTIEISTQPVIKHEKEIKESIVQMTDSRQSSVNNQVPANNQDSVEQEQEEEEMVEIKDEDRSNLILVLWDFTDLAEYALEHSIHFSDSTGANISLLHIVKKAKEIEEATKKLNMVVELAFKKYNKKIGIVIREGSIFEDITKASNELNADLVIMGTHGMRGMQFVTGSWAIKVIKETKAPFVVVQGPPTSKKIENVIYPVDHKRGVKKLCNEVKFLSKYFKVKFILVKPENHVTDMHKKNTISNFVFVHSYMKQNWKEHEIVSVGDTKNLTENVLKIGKERNADLILVTTTDRSMDTGIDEQKLLNNKEKIPVLIVNPLTVKSWSFSTQASAQ
jgi:nucleotide-binding universal stress UspA family protein/uncharacterized protein (UPF0332 family)